MEAHIVTGLLYGDEGKGAIVSKLVNQIAQENYSPIVVVRTGGGQNCGHKVCYSTEFQHIHNQVPSGILQDIGSTIIGYIHTDTFDPISFVKEIEEIREHNVKIPKICINPSVEVTTPYDTLTDSYRVLSTGVSSTGTGFGLTLQRGEVPGMKIFVADLLDDDVLAEKLKRVAKYYKETNSDKYHEYILSDINRFMTEFVESVNFIRSKFNNIHITSLNKVLPLSPNLIFEGNQGVSLDQHYGVFPHVTRANTVPIKANAIITELNNFYKTFDSIEYYDVIRTYKTSHNNSPLCKEDPELRRKLNATSFRYDEENKDDSYQKMFKISEHNEIELLRNMTILDNFRIPGSVAHLTITCFDQYSDSFEFLQEVAAKAKYKSTYGSYSKFCSDLLVLNNLTV